MHGRAVIVTGHRTAAVLAYFGTEKVAVASGPCCGRPVQNPYASRIGMEAVAQGLQPRVPPH